ncbi:MAG: VanZ family protein [Bacteroidota bacterium]
MFKAFKYYLPLFGWSLLILFLSTGPGVDLPEKLVDLLAPDKWAHAFVYAVMTVLMLWAFQKTDLLTKSRYLWWTIAIIFCSSYGILMEWIQQTFFPNRYFEVLDILANIIGSFTGAYLYKRFFIIKT